MPDVIDTDGLKKLFALFSYKVTHPNPEPEPPDPVLDGVAAVLLDAPRTGHGGAAAWPLPAERRERLLALAEERMGVEVRRHPDRDEILANDGIWYRRVSTGDLDLEDVSLTLALSKWWLMREGIEASNNRTVALAMRLWRWATEARTG